VDWKTTIAELAAEHRMTQREIAAACECSQAAISMLATGAAKDPRDSLGQALRNLLVAKRAEKHASVGSGLSGAGGAAHV
jgi:transcriptional regulator with XRE-family HTH domain